MAENKKLNQGIDVLTSLTNISTLILGFNKLQEIDGLRNLTTFNYLNGNQLQNIHALSNLTINKFDLTYNQSK